MTVYDETIMGAADLRRQIKLSGGLKMGETSCTKNDVVGHYAHPMGTVCPVCRGLGYLFDRKNWAVTEPCQECDSQGVMND
jgi:DnaJ-class molecular chaperone|tara:strand:- start:100 stop:342 length:243 start_codon:yes stop_codon:yes gene_type:complete